MNSVPSWFYPVLVVSHSYAILLKVVPCPLPSYFKGLESPLNWAGSSERKMIRGLGGAALSWGQTHGFRFLRWRSRGVRRAWVIKQVEMQACEGTQPSSGEASPSLFPYRE